MKQKRIKVRLTADSPYPEYGFYAKEDVGYIDGYTNGCAVVILENGKFAKAELNWIEVVDKEDAEHYFPELIESEDERIRKALIDYFRHHKIGINIFYGIKGDDIIAWLEKQGEPVREDIDSEALEEEIKRWIGCEAFPEGTDITPLPKAIEIVKNTAYHFAKFQKPVEWSEEDEIRLSHCITKRISGLLRK